LAALFRGELDWIVMKALEKDRNRRYETANGFAMDVQRYLNDEPVLACPPSAWYRLRKFVRRNQPQVIAAVVAFLTLLAGIAGTTYGLIRAEHGRQEALAGKKQAEDAEMETLAAYQASTDDAIASLIGSKPDLGPQEKTYLERTLKRWQAFAARQGGDERSRAIRAEGHFWVAHLWQMLGRREEARTEYETARDLSRELAAAFPAVPQYKQQLGRTHHNLGVLLAELGQYREAQTEYETARDLQQQLTAAFPDEPDYQHVLAQAHHNLGRLLRDLGQPDAARTEYETAGDLFKKLADAFPGVPDYRWGLGCNHNSLGILLTESRQFDAARKEYETALDVQKKLTAAFPGVPQFQQALAGTHNNLGLLLVDLGQHEAAHTEYETARDLIKKLATAFPAVSQYRVELGGSYCNLGNLVRDEGQPAESLQWFDLAVSTLTPVYEKDPRHVTARLFLRNSHMNRARAYDRLQKPAEAVKDWDRAVELSPPAEQPDCRASRVNSRLQAGQFAEAVAEVEELTRAGKWSADQWYDFACVYAVASDQVTDKQQPYADRAMELLQHAVKAGFKDAAHMGKDTDLDALRGREDFKKLLADLERN
jgi:tetratricopeptide (TPR) repeat protein